MNSTVKEKTETPKSLILFSNGMVAAFNTKGEQIGEIQVSLFNMYFEFLEQKGIDPTTIESIETIVNGNRKYIKPFKTEDGGWNYQFIDF